MHMKMINSHGNALGDAYDHSARPSEFAYMHTVEASSILIL